MGAKLDYTYSEEAEPHIQRTKEILKKYPQIKDLMGRNQNTIYFIIGIVGLQILMSFFVKDQPWWVVLVCAYLIGAFANHALFVLIHECTHNMIFKGRVGNLISGILCDLPNGFPSSVQFRKYHLKHHAFQGHYELDADLPSKWEARLIGNSVIGKTLWLLFFPLFQGLRPPRLKNIQFSSKWTWINLITVAAFDIAIFYFWGPWAFVYLFASFFFSIGLHPLGARWIQEHYLVAPPQETYSYYGPLNILAFNVGYHNEHHDFSYVPWNNLPKIRAIAPEYYNNLVYHTSWTKLLFQFLLRGDLSLFSRTLRDNKGGIKVSSSGESDFFSGMKTKEGQVSVSAKPEKSEKPDPVNT
jgi:sphingolipid delta-4 desaturase